MSIAEILVVVIAVVVGLVPAYFITKAEKAGEKGSIYIFVVSFLAIGGVTFVLGIFYLLEPFQSFFQ